MARRTYYNPMLDLRIQDVKMTPAMRDAARNGDYNDGTAARGGPLNEPDESHPHNLVSSLKTDGTHAPALDIDIPCRYVPSSTPGHGHLYFDTLSLTWEGYQDLLKALVLAGIVEQGYYLASLNRGQTLLRPPHVKKFSPPAPDDDETPW